jgi:serine/threonine protein phosphatase 1
MIYCVSDIHGEYKLYRELLSKINLGEQDRLYVLGDVVDRGEKPMEVLLDMIERPNVIPIMGNHEFMFATCVRVLLRGDSPTQEETQDILRWQNDGGKPTLRDFLGLSPEKRQAVWAYLGKFRRYGEVETAGQSYVLTHAGPEHFSPQRSLEDYALQELVWERPDYDRVYYPDKFLVTGHTPTRAISNNPRPDYIYRANRHIAIDCGAVYGGHLGAVCLDTGEEFYAG